MPERSENVVREIIELIEEERDYNLKFAPDLHCEPIVYGIFHGVDVTCERIIEKITLKFFGDS